jgi:hypothetical protein
MYDDDAPEEGIVPDAVQGRTPRPNVQIPEFPWRPEGERNPGAAAVCAITGSSPVLITEIPHSWM